MLQLSWIIIFIAVLALLSFFFSASETAVIGLSRIRLRHMLARGIKRAQSIQRLVGRLDKFIAAILIGNDFVNIAISAIVTGLLVNILGYHFGVLVATVVSSFFVLICCEITPKILATKHPEKVALFSAPLMEFFIRLFKPLIFIFTSSSNLILKLFRVPPGKKHPLITEEELRTMIEMGREEGVLSEEERKMLHRIFEFGDTKLKDVMVPRDKIISVNADINSDDLLNIFVEEGYGRLPVYSGSADNIIGIIYARDLLYILREKGLFLPQDLVRPACYVPESMSVNELLRRFQAEKMQIAIVVAKEKKAVGLVTLEDLIEEIVGEIEEEHSRLHRS